jgi:NTE family protein
MAQRALVLGGGGVTGVAWELGVLEGLRREGVDLTTADTVVGTSAGSVAATRITTGRLEDAYADQLRPPEHELNPHTTPMTWIRLGLLVARPGDESAKFRRIGKAALHAQPGPPHERIEVIRSRIGEPAWPDRDLRVTAVDVDHGAFVVFDRDSGVTLLEAVAASCAVPLVWPPVRIGGTTYVDGGMRSVANADLATGADVLVVIVPEAAALSRHHRIQAQIERAGAGRHLLVTMDAASEKAKAGNSLDPANRRASAEAGLAQGRAIAAEVAEVWG